MESGSLVAWDLRSNSYPLQGNKGKKKNPKRVWRYYVNGLLSDSTRLIRPSYCTDGLFSENHSRMIVHIRPLERASTKADVIGEEDDGSAISPPFFILLFKGPPDLLIQTRQASKLQRWMNRE
jgi:hypothetical protein